MTDEELIAFLRDLPFLRAAAAAYRIEQLVAINEALTKERDEAMQLLQTLSNMNGDLSRDMYKTKLLLAQAVRGLNAICVWGEDTYARDMARTTLAEIEGLGVKQTG
jgi:hypothetical protein